MKQTITPDFFESIVKYSTDLVAVVDRAGVYKYISDSAESILDYSADELIGQSSFSFVHEADRAYVADALQAVPAQASVPMPLFRFRTGSGAWRWFEGRATNMLQHEEVNGIVVYSRDVTGSIEASRGFNPNPVYYHSLFYNHPDSVFILDSSGCFKKVNATIGRVSGYTEPELQGSNFLDYVHPTWHERAQESLSNALKGVPQAIEIAIVTKQQKEAMLCLTIVPVLVHGIVIGIQGIAKDITKYKEAEELLRDQAEQLNGIIESITDPFVVLDNQWRYAYVNSAFAAYLGRDAKEVTGCNIWKFTPEVVTPLIYQKCQEVKRTNVPAYFQETFMGLNGAPNTMNINVAPFAGGVLIFFKDVSFEKGLESEIEKLALVASKTTNGIVILDSEGKTEWINSGFTRLTGYSLTEALQKRPNEILRGPETDKTTATRIDEKFAQGVPFSEEVLNYRKTGEEIWLKLDIIPILNENRQVSKYIVILTDVTDTKVSEHKLLQLATDLYKHNKDLQQFTYILSHNLRAPVANAVGLTNLLFKVQKDTPVFDEALLKLKESLSRLDSIITDLNSILTIRDSVQTAAKEEVSLQKVCDEVFANLQKNFKESGASLKVDIPEGLSIFINKVYIYSILYSLLTNALKYRSEERPLQVSIRCKRYRNNGTAISVSDNGSGMDMQKIKDHIFTLYSRFHPHIEGKGIGLFLVKAQVEALGGKIKVKSKQGVGTTFTIFL